LSVFALGIDIEIKAFMFENRGALFGEGLVDGLEINRLSQETILEIFIHGVDGGVGQARFMVMSIFRQQNEAGVGTFY
jgi:hypothetical protein